MKKLLSIFVVVVVISNVLGQSDEYNLTSGDEARIETNSTSLYPTSYEQLLLFNQASQKIIKRSLVANIQLDSVIEHSSDTSYSTGFSPEYKTSFIYTTEGNVYIENEEYWRETYWEKYSKYVKTYNTLNLVTERLRYEGDDNNNWVLDDKDEYTYDSYGLLLERLDYDADSMGVFVFADKDVYTYDADGNLITEMEYEWDGSGWENYSKTEYTYNSNNDITEYVSSYWNGSDWDYAYKAEYSFNSNYYLIEQVSYQWDFPGWVGNYKYVYTVDANGNTTLRLQYDWEGTDWENDRRVTNTFDSNDNLTLTIEEYWSNGAWVNSYKRERSYDSNNNEIEYIFYNWSNGSWNRSSKYDYDYDSNNNQIEKLRHYWNGFTWIESEKNVKSFDLSYTDDDIWVEEDWSYPNKIILKNEYDFDNGAWELSDTTTFYYSDIAIGVPVYDNLDLAVYPNPTSGRLMLHGLDETSFQLLLYNLSGRLVWSGDSKMEFDISGQPQGMYILKIVTPKGQAIRRIIKQ